MKTGEVVGVMRFEPRENFPAACVGQHVSVFIEIDGVILFVVFHTDNAVRRGIDGFIDEIRAPAAVQCADGITRDLYIPFIGVVGIVFRAAQDIDPRVNDARRGVVIII